MENINKVAFTKARFFMGDLLFLLCQAVGVSLFVSSLVTPNERQSMLRTFAHSVPERNALRVN